MNINSRIDNKKFIFETLYEFINCIGERYVNCDSVKIQLDDSIIKKNYLQLKNDSKLICSYLNKLEVVKQNIAIIGQLSYEWLTTYFGIVCSGNVVVPIDEGLDSYNIVKLLKQADVSIIFLDNKHTDIASHIKEKYPNLKHIFSLHTIEELIHINYTIEEDFKETVKVIPEQTAMIVFTSGTTGDSKGVMLSHQNICHDLICCIDIMGNSLFQGESTVPILPPYHVFGITASILTPLSYGMILCFGKSLKYISNSIKIFKPSLMVVVPMIVENMYDRIWIEVKRSGNGKYLKFAIKLSDLLLKVNIDIRKKLFKRILDSFGGELRNIVSGGAQLDVNLISNFRKFGISVLNGYGITECSPVVTCNRENVYKAGSVGLILPSPYCEVKILNGEILVRGSIVTKGYYKDKKSTKETFDGEWFKTGDLGYIDDDNFLFITGRKKNLIILDDGNNVSPEELEKILLTEALIKEVFVYAKSYNSRKMITALIYPDYEYAEKINIFNIEHELEKVVYKLNENLPNYKKIKRIEVLKEGFQKTSLGKIKRYKYIDA